MMLGALEIHLVEPGTVIVCPDTLVPWAVTDDTAVIDHKRGQAWVPESVWRKLQEFSVPAPAGRSAPEAAEAAPGHIPGIVDADIPY